jgi:hypothetical protein
VPCYSSTFVDIDHIKLLKLDAGNENLRILWLLWYFGISTDKFIAIIF